MESPLGARYPSELGLQPRIGTGRQGHFFLDDGISAMAPGPFRKTSQGGEAGQGLISLVKRFTHISKRQRKDLHVSLCKISKKRGKDVSLLIFNKEN